MTDEELEKLKERRLEAKLKIEKINHKKYYFKVSLDGVVSISNNHNKKNQNHHKKVKCKLNKSHK